jgi:hypothetical protein
VPSNLQEVIARLDQRPVVCISLKRYTVNANGLVIRVDTHVEIPESFRLPYFYDGHDEADDDGNPNQISSSYQAVLQSFVCHRGKTLHSGHYVAFARTTSRVSMGKESSDVNSPAGCDASGWMMHDDLQDVNRVTPVEDIHAALRKETAYLLFYQIVPMTHPAPMAESPVYCGEGSARQSRRSGSMSRFETRSVSDSALPRHLDKGHSWPTHGNSTDGVRSMDMATGLTGSPLDVETLDADQLNLELATLALERPDTPAWRELTSDKERPAGDDDSSGDAESPRSALSRFYTLARKKCKQMLRRKSKSQPQTQSEPAPRMDFCDDQDRGQAQAVDKGKRRADVMAGSDGPMLWAQHQE